MSDSEFAFAHADVIVVALIPTSCDTDLVGHAVKLVLGVGDHVTHLHASVPTHGMLVHVVDVNGHRLVPG